MTGQPRLTGKSGGDDEQPIVTATASRTSVASVPGRIVDQFQANRRQHREPFANRRIDSFGSCRQTHAGSTFLNGLTRTFW